MTNPTFSERSIKGRVAESIIRELFRAHGYHVFEYGMERSVPGIENHTRKTTGTVRDRIRTMPDFIVQDDRNNRMHFVEVKYRANGKFSLKELESDYPWPDTHFIVVSREHIKCLTYKQLAGGHSISPTCTNLLIKRVDLGLDKKAIMKYMVLAKKFFTGV